MRQTSQNIGGAHAYLTPNLQIKTISQTALASDVSTTAPKSPQEVVRMSPKAAVELFCREQVSFKIALPPNRLHAGPARGSKITEKVLGAVRTQYLRRMAEATALHEYACNLTNPESTFAAPSSSTNAYVKKTVFAQAVKQYCPQTTLATRTPSTFADTASVDCGGQ
ncbi:UNVERIFIED_ORG: hypothetical protein DFO49_4419 [Herbaspirillum seropedicae]